MRHWSNGRFGSSVAVAEDRRVVQRHNEDPDAELRQPRLLQQFLGEL